MQKWAGGEVLNPILYRVRPLRAQFSVEQAQGEWEQAVHMHHKAAATRLCHPRPCLPHLSAPHRHVQQGRQQAVEVHHKAAATPL